MTSSGKEGPLVPQVPKGPVEVTIRYIMVILHSLSRPFVMIVEDEYRNNTHTLHYYLSLMTSCHGSSHKLFTIENN